VSIQNTLAHGSPKNKEEFNGDSAVEMNFLEEDHLIE
jgi:hypothetical protein